MDKTSPPQSNTILIPVAIIIAGVLIAGAIYLGGRNSQVASNASGAQASASESKKLDKVLPVTPADHIRGNPNAPVKIVEYSDFECPFCKAFHPTMKRVMEEYGQSGQVAWVYRHFPIDQLHPVKARKEAVASECANELGGNEAFWKYTDRFFELTPSNNDTDVDVLLPQIAGEIGLDGNRFAACLTSGKYDKHIEDEVKNAMEIGSTGTPSSVVIGKNGKKYPIVGAQPYASVKQIIDLALQGE